VQGGSRERTFSAKTPLNFVPFGCGHAFRQMKSTYPGRLTPFDDKGSSRLRLRFFGVKLENDAGVEVGRHRSPRLSLSSSSELAPFHFVLQIPRARAAQSGNWTVSFCSGGKSRVGDRRNGNLSLVYGLVFAERCRSQTGRPSRSGRPLDQIYLPSIPATRRASDGCQ